MGWTPSCSYEVTAIRPAGAAWQADMSTQGHGVNRRLESDLPGRAYLLTVVAVADAAHRWLDTGVGQALGVSDRDVLAASVAVMHEPAAMDGPSFVQRLLKSIENEACMRRS